MTCAQVEPKLCDYIDGTLRPEERTNIEAHLAECTACNGMARDSAAIVAFVERAAAVDPPPQLVTRILQQIPSRQPVQIRTRTKLGAFWGRLLEPVLQPRLVMGMAMTILSFAMLGRFAGIEARQLKPSDLNPVKVWEATEDRVHRTWNSTVKYYQSLRIVYEVQSMLREFSSEEETEQQPDSRTVSPSTPGGPGAENTGPPKK